ncbi:MAG TPA: glycerol-3-phosphate acyltransferase [Anaerolineales bacterium]|nr:glycerol-3-phosphate acyltransferase [Anaerolineales bacterium]
MDTLIALLAAITGYLAGSISFARVIAHLVAPGDDISGVEVAVPGTDTRLTSNMISATTVRMNLGTRYGCLTSILDMLKAFIPGLIFKLWQPDMPYYLITAGMATIGHNWSIFHRFTGGRGLSPVLGGFLVLDWIGALVTNMIGLVVGIPRKNVLLYTGLGIVLMIPWIWFRTQNWAQILYVVAMNVIYWTAMIPELREYARLQREGELKPFQEARQLRVIRAGHEDRYYDFTLASLLDRIHRLFKREKHSA